MPVSDSILIALIVMSIVFSCLIALSVFLKAQSFIFTSIYKNKNKNSKHLIEEIPSEKEEFSIDIDSEQNNFALSIGELGLIGVDEKTTALIMAIVSDELKIPLNELQFKSIKLISS